MKILIEESVLQQALEALMIHSKHYECEDTFYSCPADETAWEEHKGECCCGADSANAAITALRTALDAADRDNQRITELEAVIKSHGIPVKTYSGGVAHYCMKEEE